MPHRAQKDALFACFLCGIVQEVSELALKFLWGTCCAVP